MIYGEGSSKDCRLHVQKLNNLRGAQEEAQRAKWEATNEAEEVLAASSTECTSEDVSGHVSDTFRPKSKWTTYLENESGNSESDAEEEKTCQPKMTHSKKRIAPSSKWADYVGNDSASTSHDEKKHEIDQMTSSNSGSPMEGRRSQELNRCTEVVEKCEVDLCGSNYSPQHKSVSHNVTDSRSFKRASNENSIDSPSKKLCEVDAKWVEFSGVNTSSSPHTRAKKDHGKIFTSTENDELDEVLKL
ncbi:uncharacterized protein [Hetaerina americana]|uniref:uncharacterized protein isoform X2 n=1 Tax=Hetaerina americana TaxID=62018 RepID=UPI003A7F51E5